MKNITLPTGGFARAPAWLQPVRLVLMAACAMCATVAQAQVGMRQIPVGTLPVTLVYPTGTPSFVDAMSGRLGDVVVVVRQQPIPPVLFKNGARQRAQLQSWLVSPHPKVKPPSAVVYGVALRDNSHLVSASSSGLAEIWTIK